MHLDLAERAHIDEPDTSAHRAYLSKDGLLAGLARQRVILRATPVARGHPHGSERFVLPVQGGAPLRHEPPSGQVRQRYGMEHRSRRRRAQRIKRRAANPAEDAQGIHVGMLSLARTHADGGKALQQLAAVESLLAGVLQILNREVLIEVDELSAAWMAEDRKGVRRALERRGPRALRRLGAKPKPARRLLARRAPVGKPLIK